MKILWMIIISIGFLYLCFELGVIAYRAGRKNALETLYPQNKRDKVKWSKRIVLPGFKIFIYRITKVEER
jgi:hypothetical protein